MLPLTDAFRLRRLERPVGRLNHAVLDTDTFNEEDDQFALAYAVKAHEQGELVLEAVYAAPFSRPDILDPAEGMELSYREIHRILGLLGRDDGRIPVLRGSTRYTHSLRLNWEDIRDGKPQQLIRPDGSPAASYEVTPVESPAARDLIERALARPDDDPLYVLTIGAATNVASALLLCPQIAEKIVIIWLAGNQPDWPSAAEYNLRQDIPAGRVLLDSGVPLQLMPANNVVRNLTTTVSELEHYLDGKNELCSYLVSLVRRACDRHPGHIPAEVPFAASKVIWDIAAVAAVVRPSYMRVQFLPAPYVSDDLRYSWDPSRHTVAFLADIYRDDVYSDLFYKLTH